METENLLPDASLLPVVTLKSGHQFYRLYYDKSVTMDSLAPQSVVSAQPVQSDNFFKVVIVGDYGVGKSSIVSRLCEDFFRETHATTIGIDYKVTTLAMPDKGRVKLEVFDTAGLDKFRSVASNYYQNASGVVIVYDVTEENSFANVENYLHQLKFFIPPDADILIVGNKCDLGEEGERRVEFSEADAFSSKLGLSLFEVSAKTGLNVQAAFVELSLKMREKADSGKFSNSPMDPEGIFGPEEENEFTSNDRSILGCLWCCL